jgi:hypothetical protein
MGGRCVEWRPKGTILGLFWPHSWQPCIRLGSISERLSGAPKYSSPFCPILEFQLAQPANARPFVTKMASTARACAAIITPKFPIVSGGVSSPRGWHRKLNWGYISFWPAEVRTIWHPNVRPWVRIPHYFDLCSPPGQFACQSKRRGHS